MGTSSHTDTGFHERVAYVLWLRSRGRVEAITLREVAVGAGLGYEWVRKWLRQSDAPRDREYTRKLCVYLAVGPDWLLDRIGEPPEPGLWGVWWGARLEQRATERRQPEVGRGTPAPKKSGGVAAGRRAAVGGRRRP